VLGFMDDQVHIAGFHHRAPIEYDDIVADVIGGREIVGDVQKRNTVLAVQGAESLEQGGAQGGIHHRHRLIGDEELGLEQERSGHGDALALTSAQLVRKAPQGLLRPEAHLQQCLVHEFTSLFPRLGQPEVPDGDTQ